MRPNTVKIGGVLELAEAPPQRVEDAALLLTVVILCLLFLGLIEQVAKMLDRRSRL